MTEYDRAGLKAPLERRPGCKELSCYMAVNLYLYGKPESPLVLRRFPALFFTYSNSIVAGGFGLIS